MNHNLLLNLKAKKIFEQKNYKNLYNEAKNEACCK
jgi:ribosomal protein L19E